MSDAPARTRPQTRPQDRVGFGNMLAYGVGGFVNNTLAAAIGGMLIVLNLGLGMNPAWVGLLGALPRLTDALTDPLMGYLSDHTRTRWGRRRPRCRSPGRPTRSTRRGGRGRRGWSGARRGGSGLGLAPGVAGRSWVVTGPILGVVVSK